MDRFDVVFSGGSIRIEYHHHKEDGTHGSSFDEAKEIVINHLERRLKIWRDMSFEAWKRSRHPTEEEMYEDLSVAEDIYAMEEEARLVRDK